MQPTGVVTTPRVGVVVPRRASTTTTHAAKKKQSVQPRVISTDGRPATGGQRKDTDDVATPLSEAKKNSLPPEMLESDPWESESFDGLGQAAQYALVAIGIVGAGAGLIATSTYNEGAVEVDFQSYESPEKAVADAIQRVNAAAQMQAPTP